MTLSAIGMRRLEALEVLATSPTPVLAIALPFRLDSRANDHRSHWAKTARIVQKQRLGAHLALTAHKRLLRARLSDGLVVRLVRIGPRELDGHDNLGMALKALTDGVADALGVNDRDERVSFVPDSEVGPWGARIEFYPLGEVLR